jgi:hypothetical protein
VTGGHATTPPIGTTAEFLPQEVTMTATVLIALCALAIAVLGRAALDPLH